ncbi:MAG TPA: hypothetical protein ENJ56_02830, partial [Anaerolineae bacterium]|nr:hypothetical protein [Anaerolineae bacterium]
MTEQPFGRFSPNGKQYIIHTPRTPRPWYNYLWNTSHVAIISQVGQGESLSQDAMGNRIPLVAARMLFVRDRDSAEFWSLNGLPNSDNFCCTHAFGYTTITSQHDNVYSKWRVFVPQNDLCEIWTIQLWNGDEKTRRLRLFSCADTLIDGPDKAQAYYMSQGKWDQPAQAATIHADCRFNQQRRCINFITSDQPPSGYDTRQRAFIGYGTWQQPDAVIAGNCHDSACEMEKPLMALQHDLLLEPDQHITINFVIGTVFEEQEILAMRRRYFVEDGVEVALQAVEKAISAELATTTITIDSLPDATIKIKKKNWCIGNKISRYKSPNHYLHTYNFTAFASHWLKRQISLGTQWARVRHNGYRDLMQDIGAMAFFNPTLALTRCERVLTYQYSNGYAPRTWLHGQLLDKDFSDNHVWIPFTIYNLVMESGDVSILQRSVKFNDGSAASIYQHAKRALDYLWADRGLHGLCRIRSGDWNDALNQVGVDGRGVSIWLSMAWLVANEQFCHLAKLVGDEATVAEGVLRSAEMRQSI